MVEYWPFFCVFSDREEVEVDKKAKKDKLRQYNEAIIQIS